MMINMNTTSPYQTNLPSPSISPSIASMLNSGINNNNKRTDYFEDAQSFFGNDDEEEEVEVEQEEEEQRGEEPEEEEEEEEEEEDEFEEVNISEEKQQQSSKKFFPPLIVQQGLSISRKLSYSTSSSSSSPSLPTTAVSPSPIPSTSTLPSSNPKTTTTQEDSSSTNPIAPKPSGRKRPRIEKFPDTTPIKTEEIRQEEQEGEEGGEDSNNEMRPPNGKRRADESFGSAQGDEEVGSYGGYNGGNNNNNNSNNNYDSNSNSFPNDGSYSSSQHQQQQSIPSQQPQESQYTNSKPLESSIFNVEPIDEFTKHVGDWIWSYIRDVENADEVEIEAKIGIVLNVRSQSRHSLPVPIESILPDTAEFRFESNMTVGQHKHYNQLLNSRVEESSDKNYPFSPVRYAHTKESDSFHTDPDYSREKIRVTRRAGSRGEVLGVIRKRRLGNLNVLSPKRWFDWRISINLEESAPLPPTPPTLTREKDRITYTHQSFQVDLTQVLTPSNNPKNSTPSITHELEVEFRNAGELLIQGRKEELGEENTYLDLVQVFLNNIRMLIRNAADP